MRSIELLAVAGVCALGSAGCYGETIEPGHRGLLFDPRGQGLSHEVLRPGYHHTGRFARLDDFDVTYSTKKEDIQTTSSEGLALTLHLEVIYKPVESELYELDTEIGPNFYDEIIGPEFRSAARGVFARHGYAELQAKNEKIEDEVEEDLRRRIKGKHIDVQSVTLEGVDYAPEIAQAIRAKLAGEQEALRQKTAMENEALRKKLEIEHNAEEAKLKGEEELRAKEHEKEMAQQQAMIDKIRSDSAAQNEETKAKAEADSIMMIAKAKKQDQAALTPLAVQLAGYEALGKLGGNGTTLLLGDWSRAPQFLFPSSLWGGTPYTSATVAARP
jgi:regulator of protease activity HflC (stomatin/prohibitin superfamily)